MANEPKKIDETNGEPRHSVDRFVGDGYCEWTEDDNGLWNTTCAGTHEFQWGKPSDNNYNWCPYCGGRLLSKSYSNVELWDADK